MRVAIDHDQIKAAAGFVGRVVPSRSPKPVLENVLVRCDPGGNTLEFIATDLSVEAMFAATARVEEPGRCLLPFKRLAQILAAVEGELTIESTADGLEVGTGWLGSTASFGLAREDPDLYPTPCLALEDGPGHWEVEGEALARALSATLVAADPDSTRYALGGVRIERAESGDGLDFVGTDGRRLHWCRLGPRAASPVGDPYQPSRSAGGVLPVEACRRAVAIGEAAGTSAVRLTLGPDRIAVAGGWRFLAARPVEGRYPAWPEILPAGSPTVATFAGPDDLARAVRQAAITTSDESRGVMVEVDETGLTASSRAADVGRARVDAAHGGLDGPRAWFVADHAMLLGALEACRNSGGDEPMQLRLLDEKSAVVLARGGLTAIVMPLVTERPDHVRFAGSGEKATAAAGV